MNTIVKEEHKQQQLMIVEDKATRITDRKQRVTKTRPVIEERLQVIREKLKKITHAETIQLRIGTAIGVLLIVLSLYICSIVRVL